MNTEARITKGTALSARYFGVCRAMRNPVTRASALVLLAPKLCTRIREILEDHVVARSKFLNGRGEGYGCSLQAFEATEVRYFCRGLRVPGREWKRFDSWSPQKASAEEGGAQAVRKYASRCAGDQTGIA